MNLVGMYSEVLSQHEFAQELLELDRAIDTVTGPLQSSTNISPENVHIVRAALDGLFCGMARAEARRPEETVSKCLREKRELFSQFIMSAGFNLELVFKAVTQIDNFLKLPEQALEELDLLPAQQASRLYPILLDQIEAYWCAQYLRGAERTTLDQEALHLKERAERCLKDVDYLHRLNEEVEGLLKESFTMLTETVSLDQAVLALDAVVRLRRHERSGLVRANPELMTAISDLDRSFVSELPELLKDITENPGSVLEVARRCTEISRTADKLVEAAQEKILRQAQGEKERPIEGPETVVPDAENLPVANSVQDLQVPAAAPAGPTRQIPTLELDVFPGQTEEQILKNILQAADRDGLLGQAIDIRPVFRGSNQVEVMMERIGNAIRSAEKLVLRPEEKDRDNATEDSPEPPVPQRQRIAECE